MCLITNEPDGYILRKDKTVYKEVVLTITRKGSVSMLTPYMDFPIKRIPCVIKASKKFHGPDFINFYYDNKDPEDDELYTIEGEGVHAYLQLEDVNNHYGQSIISYVNNSLNISVRIKSIIPKGIRMWKYDTYTYRGNDYPPDIAAEKMILKSIIVPRSIVPQDSHFVPGDVEKVLSCIEKINNGSLKLSKK